jgi:hypothetical protein
MRQEPAVHVRESRLTPRASVKFNVGLEPASGMNLLTDMARLNGLLCQWTWQL